jgi:hypothetical protein
MEEIMGFCSSYPQCNLTNAFAFFVVSRLLSVSFSLSGGQEMRSAE